MEGSKVTRASCFNRCCSAAVDLTRSPLCPLVPAAVPTCRQPQHWVSYCRPARFDACQMQVNGAVASGPSLAVNVNGLQLPNPFVIGSGPPGTNYAVSQRVAQAGPWMITTAGGVPLYALDCPTG